MSDEDARWLTIDALSSTEEVSARLQTAIDERRGRSSRRGFAGTVDKQRFMLKASSRTKDFSVEGLLNPTEEGTRVVVSVKALRHRPMLQLVVPVLIIVAGCVCTWFEASRDPDWPETSLVATAVILGVATTWLGNVTATKAEAERIGARLQALVG